MAHSIICILNQTNKIGNKLEYRSKTLNDFKNQQNEKFDSCTWESAGGWSSEFPGIAAYFGEQEPKKFLELLEEWHEMPLKAALRDFWRVAYKRLDWRIESEMRADPGLTPVDEPLHGTVRTKEGELLYLCGEKQDDIILSEQDIRSWWLKQSLDEERFEEQLLPLQKRGKEIWFSNDGAKLELNYLIWIMEKIKKNILGVFQAESLFYSLIDESSRISKNTLEKARNHPENYAILFTDLHH